MKRRPNEDDSADAVYNEFTRYSKAMLGNFTRISDAISKVSSRHFNVGGIKPSGGGYADQLRTALRSYYPSSKYPDILVSSFDVEIKEGNLYGIPKENALNSHVMIIDKGVENLKCIGNWALNNQGIYEWKGFHIIVADPFGIYTPDDAISLPEEGKNEISNGKFSISV